VEQRVALFDRAGKCAGVGTKGSGEGPFLNRRACIRAGSTDVWWRPSKFALQLFDVGPIQTAMDRVTDRSNHRPEFLRDAEPMDFLYLGIRRASTINEHTGVVKLDRGLEIWLHPSA